MKCIALVGKVSPRIRGSSGTGKPARQSAFICGKVLPLILVLILILVLANCQLLIATCYLLTHALCRSLSSSAAMSNSKRTRAAHFLHTGNFSRALKLALCGSRWWACETL